MTMIVDFADGFSSASPPNVSGAVQEDYIIENNMSAFNDFDGLIFDSTKIRSAFCRFELMRKHTVATIEYVYRQMIELDFIFDGVAWSFSRGLQSGSDMVQNDTLVNDFDVIFNIDATTGQVGYKSNDMIGDLYKGTALASITRMAAP